MKFNWMKLITAWLGFTVLWFGMLALGFDYTLTYVVSVVLSVILFPNPWEGAE